MKSIATSLAVDDLKLVLALAESGSTVRASAVLHLTQSAVSRGLISVEERLGARLFERNARGLSLTAAGRRFVGGAGAVLAALASFEDNVRHGEAGVTPLRLVSECYTAYRWLPATLAALRLTLPSLDVSVMMEHTKDPVPALLDREVDIALVTTAKVPKSLESMALFTDEIVFVMAATHPLADREALSAADVRGTTLISSTAASDAERQWFFHQVFGKKVPRVQHLQFPLTETIVDAARARMGVAAMSEWVARPYVANGELVAKPFCGKRLLRPWRMAYRHEMASQAKHLAAALSGAPPRLFASRAS